MTSTVRSSETAARASETAASASKAAASASDDAVGSASRVREAISRAREALPTARVDSTTKTRRFAEAGVQALYAIVPAPVPALGQGTPHQSHTSDVAVDAWTRRPGNGDVLQGSVACMAAEPNPRFPFEAATVAVSTARRLRREMPDEALSVNDAWIQIADGPWEAQQRRALTMALVVSLRKAHDASSTTAFWPEPQA